MQNENVKKNTWYPNEKTHLCFLSVPSVTAFRVFNSAGRRWDFEEWLLPVKTRVLAKMLQGRTEAGSSWCCDLAHVSLCDCSVAQWPSLTSKEAALEPFCPGLLMSPLSLGITQQNFWGCQEGVGEVRALTAHKIQGRCHPTEWWGVRPAKSTWNCILPPARHKSWDSCPTIPTEHHLYLLWLLKDSVFDLLVLNTTLLQNITYRYKFNIFP